MPPELSPPDPARPTPGRPAPHTTGVDLARSRRRYPALSYELYPPRSPAAEEPLWRTITELEATGPDYVAVTYSSSGHNRSVALGLLDRILTETTLRPLAHLTCVGGAVYDLEETIDALLALGVRGILALRGDIPEGADGQPVHAGAPAEQRLQYADELVQLIRDIERGRVAHLCGGRVAIGVAAYPTRHPESPSLEHDVQVLRRKQDRGADFAITQVFFDAADYSSLVHRARIAGVSLPIIPGLIPLTSPRRLTRLAELAGIAPDMRLMHKLETARSDAERMRIGIDATVDVAHAALDAGAPGIHLYTFNEHTAALEVLDRLDLPRPERGRRIA